MSGEPFDYLIITKHGIVCFASKQTIQTKWNILKVTEYLAKNIDELIEDISIDEEINDE